MIADLTTAWVTLAADNSNLALAQQTMASAKLAQHRRPPDGGRHRLRRRPERCRKRLSAGARQRRQLSHAGGAG
jgi:hypothetical protein